MPAIAMFDPTERAVSFFQKISENINCHVDGNNDLREFDVQTNKNDFELKDSNDYEFVGTGRLVINNHINPIGRKYNFWRIKK